MNSYLKNQDMKEKIAYRDDIPASDFAPYNKALTQSFHSLNQGMNDKLGARLGPRNINSLTDREYDRLVSMLNRLANL